MKTLIGKPFGFEIVNNYEVGVFYENRLKHEAYIDIAHAHLILEGLKKLKLFTRLESNRSRTKDGIDHILYVEYMQENTYFVGIIEKDSAGEIIDRRICTMTENELDEFKCQLKLICLLKEYDKMGWKE